MLMRWSLQWARMIGLSFIALMIVGSGEESFGPSTTEAKRRKRHHRNMPSHWTWPPDSKMLEAARQCYTDLQTLDVEFEQTPRPPKVAAPIVIATMKVSSLTLTPIFRKPPFVMDCHLARALARLAPKIKQLGIAELRFSTIHQYRRVRLRGRTLRALSRHSLGLAIDVYQLVTTNGEIIIVEEDYSSSKIAQDLEAALIESGEFRAVLTPGTDPRSHYDHFHLEARMVIPGTGRQSQMSSEEYGRAKKLSYERKKIAAVNTPAKRRAIARARQRSWRSKRRAKRRQAQAAQRRRARRRARQHQRRQANQHHRRANQHHRRANRSQQ